MTGNKPDILLIEDSGLMRIMLSDILQRDNLFNVVDTANNGYSGVSKALALKPDVVITDMVMPEYDGLYVVKRLMEEMPVPIILLSSLDRNDPKIFDALKEGAFDFIDKPQDQNSKDGYGALIKLVKAAVATKSVNTGISKNGRNNSLHTFEGKANYDVVVIGASTGGPSAIEYVVSNFPENFELPVIIIQHMPERFLHSFAERIATSTKFEVCVAQDGQRLEGHKIYLAPGSSNMRLVKGKPPIFRYVNDRYPAYNLPSIDCVFESVSSIYGQRAIGVVLTGMGKDGTEGLLKMKQSGALTLSQDEYSAVVYGMPKIAFDIGASLHQVPLKEIPGFIVSAL